MGNCVRVLCYFGKMKLGNRYKIIPLLLISLILLHACDAEKRRARAKIYNYEKFKDSILTENEIIPPHTHNIFDDDPSFIPGVDSVVPLFNALDTALKWEDSIMQKMDTLIRRLKNMEGYSPEEKEKVKENIKSLDSFFVKNKLGKTITCREKDCFLYVEVIKSRQMLYLYLDKELKDSFPVSTGTHRYPTPDLNVNPSGPLFARYTSKKWPGGDYKGLG